MDILLISNCTPDAERKLFEKILERHQVGIKVVASYKKSIEDLIKYKYNIVILYCFDEPDDLKTIEVVRIMKEILPSLSIIAISQNTPLEVERELRKSGLYYYLTSPIEENELNEVLTGVINKEMKRRNQ